MVYHSGNQINVFLSRKKTSLHELKTIFRMHVRNIFIKKYGIDPPVINGDQMPLHRNENASQKKLRKLYAFTWKSDYERISRN